MIANVVDRRSNPFDLRCDAYVEATCEDNDKSPVVKVPERGIFLYGWFPRTTVEEAFQKTNERYPDLQVTVYLYDWDAALDPSASASD